MLKLSVAKIILCSVVGGWVTEHEEVLEWQWQKETEQPKKTPYSITTLSTTNFARAALGSNPDPVSERYKFLVL